MIFGDVPVADARGLILAHSVRLPGGAFKKGRVLSADDVAVLLDAKIETVSGARLEADDVGEDEAAETVARAVCGPGLTLGNAFTGRCTHLRRRPRPRRDRRCGGWTGSIFSTRP